MPRSLSIAFRLRPAPLALLLLAAAASPASADELLPGPERGFTYAYAGYQHNGQQVMQNDRVQAERVAGDPADGERAAAVRVDTTGFQLPAGVGDGFVGAAVGTQVFFSGGEALRGDPEDFVLSGEVAASGGFEGSQTELQVVAQKDNETLGERPTFTSRGSAWSLPPVDAEPAAFRVRLSELAATGEVDLRSADELQVVLICNGSAGRLGSDADNRVVLAKLRLEGPLRAGSKGGAAAPPPEPE